MTMFTGEDKIFNAGHLRGIGHSRAWDVRGSRLTENIFRDGLTSRLVIHSWEIKREHMVTTLPINKSILQFTHMLINDP
jgi:hypothetical protein